LVGVLGAATYHGFVYSERPRRGSDPEPGYREPRQAELQPLVRALDDLLTKLRHKIEAERIFVANAAQQFLREELAHFVPAASARNIEISLEAPDSVLLQLEAHTLQSLLQNLIDNAIRYGREGGRIVVELLPSAGVVRLSVADDGPGIPESDRERVFDRFYRGAGRDEASGTGLGLTIVKQAAIRMGADLQVTRGLDAQGCCFTLEIRV
jgi:signal transduction histidine kinase